MSPDAFLYVGSITIALWGIAHIVPTRGVLKGFGAISEDNRRILTMEWIAEGLTLCFIGALVLLLTLLGWSRSPVSLAVYRASALMLAVMAVLTAFTGARTSVVPIKICPIVKSAVALLFLVGSSLT